jgi:hypothetical protein
MSKMLPTDPERNNPAVQSKFDRSHGKGLKPPHLSHPGAVAPVTGTKVAGHNENGHKMPKEASVGYGEPQKTHHEPHAGRMAEGTRTGHTPKSSFYDEGRKG